ncbi:MAG TPA: hypothetical protein VFN19_07830 [Candidatus Nanopelagicales bacterium]|nr:hypothetical protein [Candidatus Nanopelagicales bacterium]
MNTQDDYLGSVHGIVIAASDDLTDEQQHEVWHLIYHGEPAEALRTLAWIISDEDLVVDRLIVMGIRRLTDGFLNLGDLPADLDSHIR